MKWSFLFLRSFSFYIVYILSALMASLMACLMGPFIKIKKRQKIFSLWPRFVNWLLYFTCDIKIQIYGIENILEPPCIIVSNHQGQWETFYFQYFFSPMCTLLKRELLYIPLWGWGLFLLNPISINRNKPRQAVRKVLKEGAKKLEEGYYLLIFPEGSRMKKGEVGKYTRSAFELALKSNTRILPIIHNSGDCWPAHKFFKLPGKINIKIGKPIKVVTPGKSARDVEAWAREQLELMNGS